MNPDSVLKLNTIAESVGGAGPNTVGAKINYGKISEGYPMTAEVPKPMYKDHVTMHAYERATGLSHSHSLSANLDRTKTNYMFK
jgi:hypothetical protein